MGPVIVINLPPYANLRIQETFPSKHMCWVLVGIRRQTPRDNEFVVSVASSVAIKMANVSRNGDRDQKDLGRFVISQ